MSWTTVVRRVAWGMLGLAGLTSCDSFDKGFKESFTKEFTQSCVNGAKEQGAPVEIVRPICECTAGELTRRHSVKELMVLAAKPDSAESSGKLDAAMAACTPGEAAAP